MSRRKTNRRRVPLRVRLKSFSERVTLWLKTAVPYATAIGLFVAIPYVVYLGYDHVVSSQYFAAKTVEVTGLDRVERDRFLRDVGVLEGMNVFDVDTDRVQQAALLVPWIKKANVEVKLPNRVLMTVEEKTPSGVVRFQRQNWYVDATGQMIESNAVLTPEMPLITGLDMVDANELATRIRDGIAIDEALKVLDKKEEKLTLRASEIHFEPVLGYSVVLLDGVEVRLGFDQFGERLRRATRVLREQPKKVSYVLVDHGLNSNRVIVGQ